jgi:glycogen(starch) synthase
MATKRSGARNGRRREKAPKKRPSGRGGVGAKGRSTTRLETKIPESASAVATAPPPVIEPPPVVEMLSSSSDAAPLLIEPPPEMEILASSSDPDPAPPALAPAPIHGKAEFEIGSSNGGQATAMIESANEPASGPVEAPEPAPAPVSFEVSPPPVEPARPAEAAQQPLLFEIGWEVGWQLGGIYTVLKTKAPSMVEEWGDRYCLIGPYNPATADVEFEEQTPDALIRETLERLRRAGVGARYGRWLVPGRPRTILIDHRSRYTRLGEDKYLLWKDHSISTDRDDGEVNDVTAFGFATAEFFRELVGLANGRPILAHFHEWMGGVAVPRIAHLQLPIATVFTTHATLLGRYLASDDPYFYDHLPFTDPDKEAARFNIYPRFAIERAAAHASTVFTTVSEVTAVEAEKLLGRTPEVILPNGLNIERFMAVHEFQNLHRLYKERIHEFVMGHFFPAYEFDLDNTLYFFTSGRYEYRNKGMDIFIEAMARLNWRLKSERAQQQGAKEPEQSPPTIVAFIVTRAATRNINVGVLQNQTMFDELRQTVRRVQEGLGPVLLKAAAHGRFPTAHELFGEEEKIRWKRAMAAWKNRRQPPIVTHDLADDAHDPILTHIRHRGLFNAADDPVKMIFHPDFLTAMSPLLHLDYDQFVRGCHMGIFPSYYEPWGYTPMEAIAMGVPAVTSDLSGFGAYVERHIPDHQERGIYVCKRRQRSFDDSCNALVDYLYQFVKLNRRQRIELRNKVERLGELFDWKELVKNYDEAHEMALERLGRRVGRVEVRLV